MHENYRLTRRDINKAILIIYQQVVYSPQRRLTLQTPNMSSHADHLDLDAGVRVASPLLYLSKELERTSFADRNALLEPSLTERECPPEMHERSSPIPPPKIPAIHILPDELMEAIFFQTQDDEVDAGFRRRTIASVCRKWRNLAISCRRLWYWVACVPKSAKSRDLLNLFVSRADGRIRELTLTDITLTDNGIDFRTLGQVLSPSTCEGIKGLIIQTREAHNVKNLAFWSLSLPNVEYIRVQMVESGNSDATLVIPTPFLLNFPKATKLELHDFMPAPDAASFTDDLPPVTTIELTRYNLGSLSDHVVSMLNCFPGVERLQLDGYIHPTPIHVGLPISMESITHLTFTISDIFGSAAAFRDTVHFPNLQYLGTLAYPIPDLGSSAFPYIKDFFVSQSTTKSLKTVRLILQPDPDDIHVPEKATTMTQQLGCLCYLKYVERLELDSDKYRDSVITTEFLEEVMNALEGLLCEPPQQATLFPSLTSIHFSAMRMLRHSRVLNFVRARNEVAEQTLDSLSRIESVSFEGCEAMSKEESRQLKELTKRMGPPGCESPARHQIPLLITDFNTPDHAGRIGQTQRSL